MSIKKIKPYFTLFNIARVIAAIIMLQTLRYKFLWHPESVEIFSQIGMEPTWRILTWIAELIVSILLFIPKWVWLWALWTIALMSGAIYFHIAYLWIDLLFFMACITLLCWIYLLHKTRKTAPKFIQRFIPE